VTQKFTELTELQKVADEVRAGKRVILFPPGQLYFVTTIIISLAAFGLSAALVSAALTLGLESLVRAKAQFFSVFLVIPLIVFPGIMIIRGKKRFASLLRGSFIIYLVIASFMIARALLFGDYRFIFPYSLIFSLSLLGLWVSYRPGFYLYCEFFYLVKCR
jgi:hypothetical protein